jgi:predicted nucleotidyltransferase
VTTALEAAQRLRDAAASGQLDEIAERLGVRLLGIFGSAARPAPGTEPRDLDVAVSFRGGPRELELIDALTQLTDFDRIDLAVLDGAAPLLRAEGLVGVALYEDEAGAWANEQMAALAERRDTQWLRDLDRQALAEP